MQEGVQLKYGQIRGGHVGVEGYMAESQTLSRQSGRFVYLDAAGRLTLCSDGASSRIWGSVESGLDAEAPSVDDRVNCNISLDAVYRIPVNSGTFVKAMIGDTCDLSVSNNVQGAQLDASDENIIVVVDGDLVNNNWVDVKINPAVWGTGNGVLIV
jgi:hypothetical protein